MMQPFYSVLMYLQILKLSIWKRMINSGCKVKPINLIQLNNALVSITMIMTATCTHWPLCRQATCKCTSLIWGDHHEQLYALAMKAYIAISGRMTFHRYQDVPGLSQDVPHGIFRTSSQPLFAGCPRTVPGRPSWDPPDIQSTPVCRMSQDYPRTSRLGSSLANPLCLDSPGMCPTLIGNTGHLSYSTVKHRV